MKRLMDSDKMLWHMDTVHKFEKGERIAPIHIDMGISKFCNINCVFCYGIYQNRQRDFIQEYALLQTMRDAKDIGVKSVAIIGDGEPTMNPYLFEALEEGKRVGLSLSLSTSGVLLDTEEKQMNVLKNTEWMRFCIAAGTKDQYKQFHRVNQFEKVRKNIESMVKIKEREGFNCDIGLQAVYVPGIMNQAMIDESKLAVDLGVDYFVIKQCSLPDGNQKVGDVIFNPKEYDELANLEALKIAESYSNNKTKIIPKWNVIAQKGIRDYKGCPAIPFISEISGNGDWYPCGFMFGEKKQFEKYKFGNLHEKSLKEIWESDRYWDIVEQMKNYNVQKDCAGCCRQDQVNRFLSNYLDKPKGVNFI